MSTRPLIYKLASSALRLAYDEGEYVPGTSAQTLCYAIDQIGGE